VSDKSLTCDLGKKIFTLKGKYILPFKKWIFRSDQQVCDETDFRKLHGIILSVQILVLSEVCRLLVFPKDIKPIPRTSWMRFLELF
jgi:hypothetical protein